MYANSEQDIIAKEEGVTIHPPFVLSESPVCHYHFPPAWLLFVFLLPQFLMFLQPASSHSTQLCATGNNAYDGLLHQLKNESFLFPFT